MENKKKALFALIGGAFCATAGPLFATLVVEVLLWSKSRSWSVVETAELFVFAAIPAGPFGLIVGSAGSWLLASRLAGPVSLKRVVLEAAGLGTLLGATFPLVATVLGWGPLRNLISILPISIGTGAACGIALTLLIRAVMPK